MPSDDVLSYRFGYAHEGIGKIQANIAPFATDPARPVMVMPSTDGDNAWGGGSSSWFEATPAFFNAAGSAGYGQSAVQDFVNAHGAAADTVHIEDGAWIFPESCYGSPNFLKWIEPPLAATPATRYPGTHGGPGDARLRAEILGWAPVIAGANWCETAEQILARRGRNRRGVENPGSLRLERHTGPIPTTSSSPGTSICTASTPASTTTAASATTMRSKPPSPPRRAIEKLQPWMTTARRDNDRTPPRSSSPSAFPTTPAPRTSAGSTATRRRTTAIRKMPSEFYVWTHAYDVSGIASVALKVRIDNDGMNSLATNQNETYAGGAEVGTWITIPMTKRVLPNTQAALNAAANNSQINYFITPPELADYYFAKITDANLPDFRGKLLDYYIEATDTRDNVHKSDIQHVFVEDDGNQNPANPIASGHHLARRADRMRAGHHHLRSHRPQSRRRRAGLHPHRPQRWQNRITPRPAMTLAGTKWTIHLQPASRHHRNRHRFHLRSGRRQRRLGQQRRRGLASSP